MYKCSISRAPTSYLVHSDIKYGVVRDALRALPLVWPRPFPARGTPPLPALSVARVTVNSARGASSAANFTTPPVLGF